MPLVTMIAALAFVLGLMGILYLVLKKLGLSDPGGGEPAPASRAFWDRLWGRVPAGPPQKRRLQVVETLALSPTHRAIILRMDDTDHLVILGPNGQSVTIPAGVSKNVTIPRSLE